MVGGTCGRSADYDTIHAARFCQMGLADADIYASLENRMTCGVGKCGPVFTLEEIKRLPKDY